jgi:hypothetical protein
MHYFLRGEYAVLLSDLCPDGFVGALFAQPLEAHTEFLPEVNRRS